MTTPAHVLYDGECPLCRKSVGYLARLDWLKRLDYVNIRQPHPILESLPVPQSRLLEEMHVVPPSGRVYHGFKALRWLAWRLVPMWPIAPFLYIPGVPQLGQRLYLWVARNRLNLMPCHGGVCTIQKKR